MTLQMRVYSEASQFRGVPYRYGGTSPRTGFDCSGYTSYLYKKAGHSIPRTAQEQFNATIHEGQHPSRGDLIFFYDSSGVYHVGIYAGNDMVWHAPHTGAEVRLERIWTHHWIAGRVR